MFRSRKYSSSEKVTSSLSSGNASIKRPAAITTTPTEELPAAFNDEDINENEIIDLQAAPQELTIESMSAVIAAAVQMSASGGAPSSLSIGSASILQPFSKTENTTPTTKRRFSVRLFSNSWKKSKQAPSPSTPTTPSLEPSSPFDSIEDDNSSQGSPRSSSVSGTRIDDGRDELLYRGIQIKEIKSTLKTLVISDEERFPMPEVRLERPGFARINY